MTLVKDRGCDKRSMSQDHNAADAAYRNYMLSKSVVSQLWKEQSRQETEKQLQVKRIRKIFARLFDVTRLIAKLGLPFRGHRENTDSQNKGVYRELVEFIADPGGNVLNDHLQKMADNATYLSPTIQNEMIDVTSKSVPEKVVSNVKQAGIFSVLMDETMDASHQGQVSVMVRYVDMAATVDTEVIRCSYSVNDELTDSGKFIDVFTPTF